MLARNRFDPEALVRVVNAVQLRVGFQPLQPLGETDIEVRKILHLVRIIYVCTAYEELFKLVSNFLKKK